MEVSATEKILQKFPNSRNSGGAEYVQTVCTTDPLFSTHTKEPKL